MITEIKVVSDGDNGFEIHDQHGTYLADAPDLNSAMHEGVKWAREHNLSRVIFEFE